VTSLVNSALPYGFCQLEQGFLGFFFEEVEYVLNTSALLVCYLLHQSFRAVFALQCATVCCSVLAEVG